MMAFNAYMTANIVCDHEWKDEDGDERGCTESDSIRLPIERTSVVNFLDEAKKELERRGWSFFGGIKCPNCALPDDPDEIVTVV